MSFSEDQFVSKLNALDETQESIVSASKWLLTQYKEVNQIAHCWKRFVIKPTINTRRKLLAIYLANDVIQQAKHKRVGDFGTAFGAIMPEVLGEVYPGLNKEMRKKVRRVVDIWKQRQVFSDKVIKDVYPKLKDTPIKPSRSDNSSVASVVPELRQVVSVFDQLSKSQASVSSNKTRFDSSLEALDPSSVVYSENYKTVQKIGQVAKDALQKSMELRSQALKELKIMLDFQTEQAQQDQEMINEIDAVLAAKDPSKPQPSTTEQTDLLPTYEASDGSDSDTDKSDIEEDTKSSKRHESFGTVAEKEDMKRLKMAAADSGGDINAFEAEVYEPTPAEVAANSSMAVTSSIQDLLSKLAS
ncbi:LANO_0H10396g1_1 [Lachancea nothofagi CBS 11611]|uniref:LANO_0H10396g1_1 n=1 Tax=Lachancea nothofagi CBS 11611 TaxID=1266666 RepID=A0A1G4KM40_9SACH|nr:LANO_0H10396g1_1 [Lachancea nothofagi CBS 11611]